MDKRTYGYEKELEHINVGDLVNVKVSTFQEPPLLYMGIVLEKSTKNNKTLFPSVRVYNLETKRITREFVGSLKVISAVDSKREI